MTGTDRRRRGAALLEALIALAVLGTVGSAAAWQATESMRAVNRMHEREQEQRAAARLLTAISLWPREDLDRHLGSRVQGPWRVRIDRPALSALYTVSISDTASGTVLLETALYREDTNP
jgi:type II secretory pathway component PulK